MQNNYSFHFDYGEDESILSLRAQIIELLEAAKDKRFRKQVLTEFIDGFREYISRFNKGFQASFSVLLTSASPGWFLFPCLDNSCYEYNLAAIEDGLSLFAERTKGFLPPNENDMITFDEVNYIIKHTERTIPFLLDIIAPSKTLFIALMNNSHADYDGVRITLPNGELRILYLLRPRLGDCKYIFAYELGYSLQWALTGKQDSMPPEFAAFRGSQSVLRPLQEQKDDFAHTVAMAILCSSKYESSVFFKDQMLFLPSHRKFIRDLTEAYYNG
ncbi:MAG: hypothetical protein LBU32_21360 [Clostridiales bacterium]|nr:hypothetical protein [Clostridiales bacterium]